MAAIGNGSVVCVLGMSRSGTSVTARILNLLGVDLGPEEGLVTPNAANKTGYWERHAILEVNDGVLSVLGGTYLEPPRTARGWALDPGLDLLRRRAMSVVESSFGGQSLWGFKDPRTCLTLPFWRQVVPNMRHVICVRHPTEVAASLAQYPGYEAVSSSDCDRLWIRSLAEALVETRGSECMIVFYDDFFVDLDGQIERLGRFIDRPIDAGARDAATAFVEAGLRHHRASSLATSRTSSIALELYEAVAAARGGKRRAINRARRMARRLVRQPGLRDQSRQQPRRTFVPGRDALRSFGVYDDGWLRREAYFALDGGRRGQLVLAFDSMHCERQSLEIAINRTRAWYGAVDAGPLELTFDVRSSEKTWHVELRWAKEIELASPDRRVASAILRSAVAEARPRVPGTGKGQVALASEL